MKNKSIKKIINILLAFIFWLIVWEIASKTVCEDLALFLPEPLQVFKAFCLLFFKGEFWLSTATTLLRIFTGLVIGSVLGILLGILTAEIDIVDTLISPALKVIRAVPVVSFIILAFLFINVDYLPVFISSLMVTPLVWQATYDGIKNTDNNLLEMAKVYKVNKFKTLLNIKIPICTEQIISSLISAVGLAWKSGIAAEVICTPLISIGKNIYSAKGNLNFDEVYALTLTVVILSLIFEITLKYLFKKFKSKGVKNSA